MPLNTFPSPIQARLDGDKDKMHNIFTIGLWHLSSGLCCQILFTPLVRLCPEVFNTYEDKGVD